MRAAAESRFLETAAALESKWKAVADAGFGAFSGYALDELGKQRVGLAACQAGDIDRRSEAALERDALLAHAIQTLKSLGERGRAGALAALPKIQSDAGLRAAMSQTLSAGSAVESYLATISRAREGLEFLGVCESAQIPLAGDVLNAKAEVEKFLANPTLAAAMRAERLVSALRPTYLDERLLARRDVLLHGVEVLTEPARRPLLEAWREGFADAVGGLRSTLAKNDWRAAAPTLREVSQFLDARAEARVRMVASAAQAQGFKAAVPSKTTSARWTTVIADEKGQLFTVSEAVPQWQGLHEFDATLEFNGPQNYEGPACMTVGLREICDQLRSQGVALRIFQEGKELLAGPQVRESQATGLPSIASTAAVRPQKPKLQQ